MAPGYEHLSVISILNASQVCSWVTPRSVTKMEQFGRRSSPEMGELRASPKPGVPSQKFEAVLRTPPPFTCPLFREMLLKSVRVWVLAETKMEQPGRSRRPEMGELGREPQTLIKHVCMCVYPHTYVYVCVHTYTHTVCFLRVDGCSQYRDNKTKQYTRTYLCPCSRTYYAHRHTRIHAYTHTQSHTSHMHVTRSSWALLLKIVRLIHFTGTTKNNQFICLV